MSFSLKYSGVSLQTHFFKNIQTLNTAIWLWLSNNFNLNSAYCNHSHCRSLASSQTSNEMMRVLFRWDYVQNVQVGNLGLGGECCIQIKNGVTKKISMQCWTAILMTVLINRNVFKTHIRRMVLIMTTRTMHEHTSLVITTWLQVLLWLPMNQKISMQDLGVGIGGRFWIQDTTYPEPKWCFCEIVYFVGLLLLQDEEDDWKRCWHDRTLKRLVW